jgi:hypothetical protein
VQVPILSDDIVERAEDFSLEVISGSFLPERWNVEVFGLTPIMFDPHFATATITHTEEGAALTIGDFEHPEDSPVLTFTVTLSHEVAFDINVDVEILDESTAISGEDYAPPTLETLHFVHDAGANQAITVQIGVENDELTELDETIVLQLTDLNSPDGLDVVDVDISDHGVATIMDNDICVLSIHDAEAAEGDDVIFVVTLSHDVSEEFEVAYHTGLAEGDHAAANTDFATIISTLSSRADPLEIHVSTPNDIVQEFDGEEFLVTLDGVSPDSWDDRVTFGDDEGNWEAVGKIRDDEGCMVAMAAASGPETDSMTFVVSITHAFSIDMSFDWATEFDTATEDDLPAASGTVTFEHD